MQELDITKPVRFANGVSSLQYMFSLYDNGVLCGHVFKATRNGREWVLDRPLNGKALGDPDLDVINTPKPEQPIFSWDKPIRFKESSAHYGRKIIKAAIKYDGADLLVEHKNETRAWHFCSNDMVLQFLENYEPEGRYKINVYAPGSHYPYEVIGPDKQGIIANFNREEDAKLFKEARERESI